VSDGEPDSVTAQLSVSGQDRIFRIRVSVGTRNCSNRVPAPSLNATVSYDDFTAVSAHVTEICRGANRRWLEAVIRKWRFPNHLLHYMRMSRPETLRLGRAVTRSRFERDIPHGPSVYCSSEGVGSVTTSASVVVSGFSPIAVSALSVGAAISSTGSFVTSSMSDIENLRPAAEQLRCQDTASDRIPHPPFARPDDDA